MPVTYNAYPPSLFDKILFFNVTPDPPFISIALPLILSTEVILILLLYAIVLFIVYLSTPYDLLWHLNTSVDRTMLPVNGGIMVGSYYILNQFGISFLPGKSPVLLKEC